METLLDSPQAEGPGAEQSGLRPAVGWPGYFVSRRGDVFTARRRMFYRRDTARRLAAQQFGDGKPFVLLIGADGKKHKVGVARLVREAFGEAEAV